MCLPNYKVKCKMIEKDSFFILLLKIETNHQLLVCGVCLSVCICLNRSLLNLTENK